MVWFWYDYDYSENTQPKILQTIRINKENLVQNYVNLSSYNCK